MLPRVNATADFIENQDRTSSIAITVAIAAVIFVLIALVIVKLRGSSARQEDILPTSVRSPTSKGASDVDQLRKLAQLRGRKLAQICVTPARHPGKFSSRVDRSPSDSGDDDGNSDQAATTAAAAAAAAAAATSTPSAASTPLGSMETLSAKALGKQPIDTPDASSTRINSTQVELRSDHYMHRF